MFLLGSASPVLADEADAAYEEGSAETQDVQDILYETAPVTPYPNESTVFRFLRKEMGLNNAAACGVMANLEQESHFEPNVGYYIYYGIVQWGGGRLSNLQTWCAQNGLNYRSLDGQLRFMRHELETEPAFQYSQLRAVPDSAAGASQAALIFAAHYERAASSLYASRQALAVNKYYPHYANADLDAPVIHGAQVERNREGYLVTIDATDNVGIDRVQLAVWSEHNGQDDLAADWSTSAKCRAASIGGSRYQYLVHRADHNNELGRYQTHIYVYDAAGNSAALPLSPVDVIEIHDFSGREEIVREATCSESGVRRVHCVDECGQYVEHVIPALGHDYTEWKVEESGENAGKETRTCVRCDLHEVREVPEYLVLRRLYNSNSGEHFYSSEPQEIEFLKKAGWSDEGDAWNAPYKTGRPVYRLYNPNAGDHHYTLSETERDYLVAHGWKDEGIGWNSADESGAPVYRQYNPNAKCGSHNFTLSEREHGALVGMGWKDEGIAWYGVQTDEE